MSDTPEFSHLIDRRFLPAQAIKLEADAKQRSALAQRFGIEAVDLLRATLSMEADGDGVHVTGTMDAAIIQSCAVSGDDLAQSVKEDLSFRFVPESAIKPAKPDEEIELTEEELDEIPYSGTAFDLGEAVAQSLALAIDPFAIGPKADEARRRHGLIEEGEQAGPLADALRGLTNS